MEEIKKKQSVSISEVKALLKEQDPEMVKLLVLAGADKSLKNSSGNTPPASPRYTFPACVSFPSFTTELLTTCKVVVYLLRKHRMPVAFLSAAGAFSPAARSTELYLTNICGRTWILAMCVREGVGGRLTGSSSST